MPDVKVVVGLGFGDEGKGSTVDHLCRKHQAKLVVRFNGGAQAAHHVVLPDGRYHCFAQFGSGTLAGANTYLSRYMVFNPHFLRYEEEHLQTLGVTDAYQRLFIDKGALITTPFHVAANRFRELHREALLTQGKGLGRHGSCGMGIGETVSDALLDPTWAIRVGDLDNPSTLRMKLQRTQGLKLEEFRTLYANLKIDGRLAEKLRDELGLLEDSLLVDDCMEEYYTLFGPRGVRAVDQNYLEKALESGTTVFEGAQGVLLDEEWGFHPHTTWSNCTFGNALSLLQGFSGEVSRIGVTRAYHTRHGAGPFPTQDKNGRVIDHNTTGAWQGDFRVGFYDFVLARYARKILGKLDEVVVGHLDQVQGPQKVCFRYDCSTKPFYRILPSANTWEVYMKLQRMFDEEGTSYEHFLDVYGNPVFTTIPDVDSLISRISKTMRAPVTLISYGPTTEDKESVCRR